MNTVAAFFGIHNRGLKSLNLFLFWYKYRSAETWNLKPATNWHLRLYFGALYGLFGFDKQSFSLMFNMMQTSVFSDNNLCLQPVNELNEM